MNKRIEILNIKISHKRQAHIVCVWMKWFNYSNDRKERNLNEKHSLLLTSTYYPIFPIIL